jgi:hypothetical protein
LNPPPIVPMPLEPGGPSQDDGDRADLEQPMRVLVVGILLLGAIAVLIGWGLANAYPGG